jgi:hypothetical protein
MRSRQLLPFCSALFSLLLFSSAASALPIVSVDADASGAGVQSSATVGTGTIQIDIVISDVDPSQPLNAFELDLVFDPTVLDALSVVDGGFLASPVLVVQRNVGLVRVQFAEVSVGGGTASGGGTLATITFQTVAPGTSALDLQNVVLLEGPLQPISTQSVVDGSLTVGEKPIPEPGTMVGLATFGIVGAMLRKGRRQRR